MGSENLYAVGLQELYALGRTACYTWDCEDGSQRGSYQIGVVDVGKWIANDDGIGLSSVSTSEYSSQITRFLYTLQYDDERVGWQMQVSELHETAFHDGHYALCAAPVSNALIHFRIYGDDGGLPGHRWQTDSRLPLAYKYTLHLIASLYAMHQFAVSFHYKSVFGPAYL